MIRSLLSQVASSSSTLPRSGPRFQLMSLIGPHSTRILCGCTGSHHGSTMSLSTSSTTKEDATPTIGFVGLGNMGLPMATNLANHKNVSVFDAQPRAREAASAVPNVEVVDSLEDLADQDVLITMLPGDAAVNSVLESLHTAWKARASSQRVVVLDCSTVTPMTSQKWSQTLNASQTATLWDAPVSGGVKGATDASLTFMLGHCAALTSEGNGAWVKPILQHMGARVMECGDHVGAGAATKLCNNVALAAQMIGICEALNLGESLDVDPQVLTQVLNSSTAACWSSKVNNPHPAVAAETGAPASRDYQGGFATHLMLKDLGLAMQVASQHHVALPLTSTSKELYQLAALQDRGMQDFGVMLQVLKGDKTPKTE